MAIVGTAVGAFDGATRHWRVTLTGITGGNSSPIFVSKGYQLASFIITGTLGTSPTYQWLGGFDGVNFAQINTAQTVGIVPTQGILAQSDQPAGTTVPTGTYTFYQVAVVGTGTSFNFIIDFMSQNAS